MITCRDLTEHSSRLLAGELLWRKRLALRLHMLLCAHCRRFVTQLEWLVRALCNSGSQLPVSDTFVARVLSGLPETPGHADETRPRAAPP